MGILVRNKKRVKEFADVSERGTRESTKKKVQRSDEDGRIEASRRTDNPWDKHSETSRWGVTTCLLMNKWRDRWSISNLVHTWG